MAAYRRVYNSRHLQADCQEPGSAPELYARQSSMGHLYLLTTLQWCDTVVMCVCDCSADLASMMLQCSDLSSSAKSAHSFTRKSTVNDVRRCKPTPSMTYTESRSARHWAADQPGSLTELFTLPGRPAACMRELQYLTPKITGVMFQYSSTRCQFHFRLEISISGSSFFQISEQLLEFYANLAPSSCNLRLNSLETAQQPIAGYSSLLTVTDCRNEV